MRKKLLFFSISLCLIVISYFYFLKQEEHKEIVSLKKHIEFNKDYFYKRDVNNSQLFNTIKNQYFSKKSENKEYKSKLFVDKTNKIDFLDVLNNNYSVMKKKFYSTQNPNIVDDNDVSLLVYAVALKEYSFVERLLDLGANINYVGKKGSNSLLMASINKDITMAKLLVDNGAEINLKNAYSPLLVSTFLNDLLLTQYFIELGANVNIKGIDGYEFTPIMQSIYSSDIEISKYLIGKGANLHVKDSKGFSIISHAVVSGDIDKVKYIDSITGDLKQVNDDNTNNLMNASEYNGETMLEFLINEKDFNVNDLDIFGENSMFYAAKKANLESAKTLIEHGVSINLKSKIDGNPILKKLIINSNVDDSDRRVAFAKLLIENGININEPDNFGKTALYYALRLKKEKMSRFLIDNSGTF